MRNIAHANTKIVNPRNFIATTALLSQAPVRKFTLWKTAHIAIHNVANTRAWTVDCGAPKMVSPKTNPAAAIGAVNPAMIEIQPAMNPTDGWTNRLKKTYSPPLSDTRLARAA